MTRPWGWETGPWAKNDPDLEPKIWTRITRTWGNDDQYSVSYSSWHFILLEIVCANQSESKFLSLPLKSCQNVFQENQSYNFNKGKYEITRVAYIFPLVKVNWLISLRKKFNRILLNLVSEWLAQIISTKLKCRIKYRLPE